MVKVANVDWITIKNEYITSNISQRKLAKKYEVSPRQVALHSKEEKWVEQRKAMQCEIAAKLQQDMVDIIVEKEVDRLKKVINISDLLAEKIEIAIGQLDKVIANGEISDTGIVDTYKLRQLVQSTKDLRDIVRSDTDDNDIKKLDEVLDKIEGNI